MPKRLIMPTELKVIVSGRKFVLTQDQFKVDGPNYFTDAVAAHTSRFRGPQVKVARNPEMFQIVVDFLNGYAVLPRNGVLPSGIFKRKVALRNLLAEAKFYRLSSLEAIVEELLRKRDVGGSWFIMFTRNITSSDWEAPIHVTRETAKMLGEKHGLSASLVHASGFASPESNVLKNAGFDNRFNIQAAWEEVNTDDKI